MKSKWAVLLALVVAVGLVLGAATAYAGQTTFGITTDKEKVGDAGGNPAYGNGQHNIHIYYNPTTGNDELYFAFIDYENGNEEVKVGQTWEGHWDRNIVVRTSPDIEPGGAAIAVGPTSATDPSLVIHVAWGERDPVTGWHIYYSRSTNYGLNWSAPVNVSGALSVGGHDRSIAVDAQGGVHIAFGTSISGVYYSRSDDAGSSFVETATQISPTGRNPNIAADDAGNVFMAWDYSGVYFSKKLLGQQWTAAVQADGGYGGSNSSIAVYDASNIYIAAAGGYVYDTSNGGATWGQTLVTSGHMTDPSLVVDNTNRLHLAWACGNWSICFARTTNRVTSWTTPEVVLSGVMWPNITVDASGVVHMFVSDDWQTSVFYSKEQ